MYHHNLTDILFLAANHGFRFVPAAGPDWKGDFDRGKQPLKSIHEATADPAVLTAWAEKYKGCNWLYVPGDGQAVLDVDPRHGGDVLLAELEREHGPLPRAPQVRTGRGDGGRHRHFAVPGGLSFDADLRGNHGLTLSCGGKRGFVVPPCRHALGGQYVWELAPWDAPPAPCPGWLLALAGEKAPPVPRAPAPVAADDDTGGDDLEFVWGGGARLAAHPGSVAKSLGGEGRRPTLVSLLGRELGLGRAADDLEPEVLAWAGRCTPPLDEREALRQLDSMARRDAARHGDGRQHHTTTRSKPERQGDTGPAVSVGAGERRNPVAVPAVGPTGPFIPSLAANGDWPVLYPDALHGLPGQVVRAIAPETEADPAGVLLSLLACVGAAVGRSPRFQVGADAHRANLFACLVGDTASGKGQCWGLSRWLLERACPDWLAGGVSYGLSTGEGLIEALADPPASGDDAPADPPERALLAYETEFAKCIRAMRREGNTLSAVIRAAWDGSPLESLTKAKAKASNAHVGVLANITPEELRKLLADSPDIANGFANRFLWAVVKRQRLLPDGGDVRVLEPLVKPLADAVAAAREVRAALRRSAEARDLWHAVYPSLKVARPGPYGLATERACPQVMRVALLYALMDGSADIREDHMNAALAVWRYCDASARLIFGGGTAGVGSPTAQPVREEPLAVRVLGLIQARPGVGRTQMHEHLGNRVKAGALNEALTWLEGNRHAHRRSVSTGGRPAECWWPGPDSEGGAKEGEYATADGPAGDLPSFVWAAPAEAKDEHPADATDDFPSFAEAGEGRADGEMGVVVPPDTGERVCPAKYPDAETLEKAIRASGGRVVKHDDGRCELELVKPDPDIEAGWRRWRAEIAATYLTESQFLAELEKDRPHRRTG